MAVQSALDAKLFTILDHRPTAPLALITISLVIITTLQALILEYELGISIM